MDKMTEQDGESLDIIGENIQTLKAIFPEAFSENKVDFEALRQLLGDAVEESEEKIWSELAWQEKGPPNCPDPIHRHPAPLP